VESSRDGGCNCLGSAWIGVQIARQMPARIELHRQVWQSRFIEDAAPKPLLGRALRAKLRNNDERLSASSAGDTDQRAQAVAGPRDALLDGGAAAVGNEPVQQCNEAPVPFGRLPDQSRSQAWAIVEKIAIEQRRHEQRHHGDRLPKARQLRRQPQV
jgi:hypothetical protein